MGKSPEIEFPVNWNYKIIVDDASSKDKLNDVLKQHEYKEEVVEGNASRTGKFQAFRVSVTFHDQQSMDELSHAFSSLDCVKFLL